ncbi:MULTISPECIES: hypothetical protein [Pseudomonas]|uniref:hypothetical protein n=1 Tax=Pseudomonas TaxID=286 RepID=UPI001F032A79|nr:MULTISPECIES: hypothetical protein [Pseudomonas]MCG8294971.1 hypothetical protein [Pseudomonas entomophila]
MDAEQVWKLWRRLLRDEALQERLFQARGASEWLAGFAENERAILQAYGDQFERVKWFVENYQFRLVNSFINALETGAPLTLRALLNLGFDLPVLSRTFLREKEWFDYGPKVYSYCDAALEFLLGRAELQEHPCLRDLIGLERECVALYRGLLAPQTTTPDHYQRTCSARLYTSTYALSTWLRDKGQLGLSQLAAQPEHILVYLPTPQARHKFTLISKRTAHLYQFLEEPLQTPALARLLNANDDDQPCAADMALLSKLKQLNAIRIPC